MQYVFQMWLELLFMLIVTNFLSQVNKNIKYIQ